MAGIWHPPDLGIFHGRFLASGKTNWDFVRLKATRGVRAPHVEEEEKVDGGRHIYTQDFMGLIQEPGDCFCGSDQVMV